MTERVVLEAIIDLAVAGRAALDGHSMEKALVAICDAASAGLREPPPAKADVVAVDAPPALLDALVGAGLSVETAPAVGAPSSPYKPSSVMPPSDRQKLLIEQHAKSDPTTTALLPGTITPGPSMADERTPAEHVEGFMRSATSPVQRAFDDLAVAEERNVWLTSRVDELLEANNRYLESERAARRRVAEMETARLLTERQLYVLREALEFYADEAHYDEAGVCGTVTTSHDPTSVGSGPESETDPDFGTVAEQALQDVFGVERDQPKVDPLEWRDLFTDAELEVIDSMFGGGARHDDTVLAMFREVAVARMKKGRKP